MALAVKNRLSSSLISIYSFFVNPPQDFDHTPLPAAPDYTDHGPRSWAAFPGRGKERRDNASELRPEGEEEAIPDSERPVDCFFLNPTTYGIFSGRNHYNAPMDDYASNSGIDMCLATQASAFNHLCRIYAPRYRQVTLAGVYYSQGAHESRLKAAEIAYEDTKRAFEYFLTKLCVDGRPFIVAAHSQGTRHMTRLLAECVEGTPMVDRFIAGYLLGGGIPLEIFDKELPSFHPCRGPLDTKCIIGWDSIPEAFPHRRRNFYSQSSRGYYMFTEGRYVPVEGKPCLATNPLTWKSNQGDNGGIAGSSGKQDEKEEVVEEVEETAGKHLGILYVRWTWLFTVKSLLAPVVLRDTFSVETRPDWDYVVVSDLSVPTHLPRGVRPHSFFRLKLFGGTYHLQDFTLFYFNVRKNAEERIKAFLAANKK